MSEDVVPRSADALAELVIRTPGILDPNNAKAADTVRGFAKTITTNLPRPVLGFDASIYKWVIGFLGAIAVMAVFGGFLMVWLAKDIPEAAMTLGAAAVGALAGLLAPSPLKQ